VPVGVGVEFDPYSRECMEDPYPVYRELLADAPVYRSERRDFWAVSRHADVQRCARDWETFSSREGVDLSGSVGLAGPGGFLDMDPPRHDQLRHVVRDRFTPKAVKSLEGTVREFVQSVSEDVVARGSCDIAQDLARPLPLRLICTLLGFPAADDVRLGAWFDAMVRRVPGTSAIPSEATSAASEMRAYIDRAATDRLRHPRDDVLTTLVGAERDGGLSPQERTGICVLLFLAGISTAAGLISTSLYLLATDLEQRARLIESPEIIPAAVEELLRFVSPVQALARVTTRPAEIAGVSVPEGARVLLVHAAANRDPRRFEDPDRLDLLAAPQRNLAFGEGIHFCLGAHLARLQTRVVLETLLPMMPAYRLDGPVRWMTTPGDRGLESVPIAV